MIIRAEKPSEYLAIYRLVKDAFKTAKVSNGDEQNYVNRLRAGNTYIPELALVAEENGKLIGHIMLTKTYVCAGNGDFEALLIAPLSVAPGHQNRGVGSKLVLESFDLAKRFGYTAVFVVGDPKYYGRFGFVSSAQFGITHVPEIPPQYVMVCELENSALSEINGHVTFT